VSTSDQATLKPLLFSGLSTSETITEVAGRGVGLKAVKQSIEEMGGTIDVVSAPRHTVFRVWLPLRLPDTGAAAGDTHNGRPA